MMFPHNAIVLILILCAQVSISRHLNLPRKDTCFSGRLLTLPFPKMSMSMLGIHEDFGLDDHAIEVEFHQVNILTVVALRCYTLVNPLP